VISWEQLTEQPALLWAGFIGAFVAGIAVAALTRLVFSRKRDRHRWDETRRLAFVRVYQSVDALTTGDDSATALQVGGLSDDIGGARAQRLRSLREAYAESAMLVRRKKTAAALDDLFVAASHLVNWEARNSDAVLREIHEATGRFFQAARRELGMPRGRWRTSDAARAWQEFSLLHRTPIEEIDLVESESLVDR
jgi:hypothetical protein